MSTTARVLAAFGVLAAIGVAAVAIDVDMVVAPPDSRSSTGDRPCPTSTGDDPYAVAQRFLTAAVERRDLRGSYALATPSLRHGVSCRDWVRGRVPLPNVPNIDWTRSSYVSVAGGTDQLVLRVSLAQPNAALPTAFLMELRQQPDGWHVGFFERDDGTPSAEPAI